MRMFFMMGVTDERRELDFSQPAVCPRCGAYSQYRAYMLCTLLSLFFIPCFRWNRRYFVELRCCGARYALDPEIGRRIERGEHVELRPEDLTPISGSGASARCPGCGFATDEDFAFCPRCGRKLERF